MDELEAVRDDRLELDRRRVDLDADYVELDQREYDLQELVDLARRLEGFAVPEPYVEPEGSDDDDSRPPHETRDAIVWVLARHAPGRDGMASKAIITHLANSEWTPNSRDPAGMIRAALNRMKNEPSPIIESAEAHGHYRLAEQRLASDDPAALPVNWAEVK